MSSLDYPDAPLARAIESNAERYKRLATQLPDSIVGLQNWLSCLPGNINEKVSAMPSDAKARRLMLKVVSAAGKRQVHYCYINELQRGTDPTSGWSPLTNASVDVKTQAIALFPALLRRILMRQRIDVQRLEQATEAFDHFAEEFGISERQDA